MPKIEQNFSFKSLFAPITTLKAVNIIVFLGLIVYCNALFNGFVWDDFPFIINDHQIQQFNLFALFGNTLFNSGLFYRPLDALYFSSLYGLFGQFAFPYHLFQVTLHIVNACFLFLFLKLLFSKNNALFLSLIFLVHPMNVESVAYISATPSELYFMFGITALLLSTEQYLSQKRLFAISTFLLLSILSKETGILFLFLIFAYRYIFKQGGLKKVALLGTATVGIYFILRIFVGGVISTDQGTLFPINTLSFSQRLINIPAILIYYIKTFLLPLNLIVSQSWIVNTMSFKDFIAPLLFCLAITLCLIYFTFVLKTYEKKQQTQKKLLLQKVEFFTLWFIIGMSLILQLVPLDMTVADRWFYFPIVGLLGLLGVSIQMFQQQVVRYKHIFIGGMIIILILLSIRTYVRVFNFKNNITLYAHDIKEDPNNTILLDDLTTELFDERKFKEALPYAIQSVSINPTLTNTSLLGSIYLSEGQYDKSYASYMQAIVEYNKDIARQHTSLQAVTLNQQLDAIYSNLSLLNLLKQQPATCIKFITGQALKRFPSDPQLYLFLAIAEYETHNKQNAIKAVTYAYNLSPNTYTAYVYNQIQNNLPIKFSQ